MPSTSREYTLSFFRPGQLAFVVTHAGQDEPDPNKIEELLKVSAKQIGPDVTISWRKDSVFSFSATPDHCYHSDLQPPRKPALERRSQFSIIFADVTGVDEDPIEFFQTITNSDLDQYPTRVSVDDLKLEAVSFNWLLSGTPGDSGSGGPGSWPVPYRGAPDRAPFQFNNLPDLVKKSRKGDGVDVVILDTLPYPHDLVVAYDEWQDRHLLIRSLLRPGGNLHVYPATYPDFHEVRRLGGVWSHGHKYKMTDHGLFAAGIVHTIAPCATIHLIEVLNPYGVGDLPTITSGLKKAERLIKEGKKVVVNCSLVLNLPFEDKHCLTTPRQDGQCFADLYTDADQELEQKIVQKARDEAWLSRQVADLLYTCDLILGLDSKIIAAAGNDSKSEKKPDRPKPRYPATLDSAQGVGALPKFPVRNDEGKLKVASYSNMADRPEFKGITTLGGEAGEGQGVLGIYLGEFPGYEPNCSKWAWWAGTSFATPIVTGVTAAVLSGEQGPLGAAQEAIDHLNRTAIRQSNTDADEDVLEIAQGYSS